VFSGGPEGPEWKVELFSFGVDFPEPRIETRVEIKDERNRFSRVGFFLDIDTRTCGGA
jgi:hypothetical protein